VERIFTPEEVRALIRLRGWPHRDLARHWGMTAVYLSRLINNSRRRAHWNDAFSGLPRYERLSSDLGVRHERLRRLLEQPQPAKRGPRPGRLSQIERASAEELATGGGGYRYRGYLYPGAILTVSRDIGDLALENERGIVFAKEDVGIGERYGIVFESGYIDWFVPDQIDLHLAETGLANEALKAAQYENVAAVRRDFEAGLFAFW
jgi:hypothetical protein